MKSYFTRLLNFFYPSVTKKKSIDDEVEKYTHMILFFTFIFSVLNIFYGILINMISTNPAMKTSMIVMGLFAFLLPFVYKYFKSKSLTSNLFVALIILDIITMTYNAKIIKLHFLFWLALGPLIAGMLIGKRSAIFWSVSSLAFVTYYFSTEATLSFIAAAQNLEKAERYFFLSISGLIFAISIFIYTYRHNFDKAKEVSQEKTIQLTNILRIVGHDISTPLQIINGQLHYLERHRQKEISEIEIQGYTRIKRAIETINNIIKHVKEYQILDSGKKKIEIGPVSVSKVIHNAIFLFQEQLNKKNVDLKINFLTPENECYVMAEPISLSNQVINNFISNAIKFSSEGSSIEFNIAQYTDSLIALQIKDHGIGIPPSLALKLFSFSEQTTRKGTLGEKGTGFGLPLAKVFMDSYGGKILVESKTKEDSPFEHGSSFTLIFQKASR